jgi:hypothetical protein
MRTSLVALEPTTAPRAYLPFFLPDNLESLLLGSVCDTLAARMRGLLACGADTFPAHRASSSRAVGGVVLRADESGASSTSLVGAVGRSDALEVCLFLVECRR